MKKFILKCLYTIFPFMLLIYVYGFYVNFYLIDNKLNNAGDLGNLGYFYIDKSQTNSERRLVENKVDTYHDSLSSNYKILTIGDSFSQQGIDGYQNYLANILGERIINYPDPRKKGYSSEEIALYLLNNNIYSKLGCKIVIIETVERDFVQQILKFRDIKEIKYSHENGDSKINNSPEKKNKKDYLMETFKYFKYQLYNSKRPVKEAELNTDCFSSSPRRTLFFYYADLWKLSISDEEQITIIDKLNYLHKQFQENDINLYYMIAPDKYDVYQPYILNNPYPPKIVIDQLEGNDFKQLEWFLNPRDKFREMIANGAKDVYYIDDTHWTTKGSETVATIIANKIQHQIN